MWRVVIVRACSVLSACAVALSRSSSRRSQQPIPRPSPPSFLHRHSLPPTIANMNKHLVGGIGVLALSATLIIIVREHQQRAPCSSLNAAHNTATFCIVHGLHMHSLLHRAHKSLLFSSSSPASDQMMTLHGQSDTQHTSPHSALHCSTALHCPLLRNPAFFLLLLAHCRVTHMCYRAVCVCATCRCPFFLLSLLLLLCVSLAPSLLPLPFAAARCCSTQAGSRRVCRDRARVRTECASRSD